MSDDFIDDGSSSDDELPALNVWHTTPKADLDIEDGDELRKTLHRVQNERIHIQLVTSIVKKREQHDTVEALLAKKIHVPTTESNSLEIENQNNVQCNEHISDTSISYACCGIKVFDIEKYQCVFGVNDVTLVSCGYNILSDLSKFEKELLRKPHMWIPQNLHKCLVMGQPHNVSNSSAFLLYLLKIASVSDSLPLLYRIEEHIKIFLDHSNKKPFISIEEILKIFINFGMIVEVCFPSEILKSVYGNLQSSAIKTFENKPVRNKYWSYNFHVTISIFDHLLKHSEIKDRHLLELFLIVLRISIDETLLHSEIRSTLKNYLNNILEKFSLGFFNSGEVSMAISNLQVSDESSRHLLLLELIKVIPIYSEQGKRLKQASSYKILCCLLQTERKLIDDKVEFSDLLFILKKFYRHLCNCKNDLWDTMIWFIDYCAGFDPVSKLSKQGVTDLNDVLRKCKLKVKGDREKEHFERMIVRFRSFIFEPMFMMLHFACKEKSFAEKIGVSEEMEISDAKRPCTKIMKDKFMSPFKDFKKPFQVESDQKINSNDEFEVTSEDDSASSKATLNSDAEHSTPAIVCTQQGTKSALNEKNGNEQQILLKPYIDQTIIDEWSGDQNIFVNNSDVNVTDSNSFVNEACIPNINKASLLLCQQEEDSCHSELLHEVESMSETECSTFLQSYNQQDLIIYRTKNEHETATQSSNNRKSNLLADELSIGENVVISQASANGAQDFSDNSFVSYLDLSPTFEPGKSTGNQELFQSLQYESNFFFDPLPHDLSRSVPISSTTIKHGYQTFAKSHSCQEESLSSEEMCSVFHTSIDTTIKSSMHSTMPEESSRKNEVCQENTLVSYSEHNYHFPDKVDNHHKVNLVPETIENEDYDSVESQCQQKLNAIIGEIIIGENYHAAEDSSHLHTNFVTKVSIDKHDANENFMAEAQHLSSFCENSCKSYVVSHIDSMMISNIIKENIEDIPNSEMENRLHSKLEDLLPSELEDLLHPEVEDLPHPEVEDLPHPEVEDLPHPEVEDLPHPEVEDLPHPEVEDLPHPEVEDLPDSGIKSAQRENSVCEEVSNYSQSMFFEIHGHQNFNSISEGSQVQSVEEKVKNTADTFNASGKTVAILESQFVNECNSKVSSIEQPSTPEQSIILNDDNLEARGVFGDNDVTVLEKLEQTVSVFYTEHKKVSRSYTTVNATPLKDVQLTIPNNDICKNDQLQITDPSKISMVSSSASTTNISTVSSSASTKNISTSFPIEFIKMQTNENVASHVSLNQLNNHSPNFSKSNDSILRTKNIETGQHALNDQLSNIHTEGESARSVSDLEKVKCFKTHLNARRESQNLSTSFDGQLESDISKLISSNDQLVNVTFSSTGSVLDINAQSKYVISVSKDLQGANAQLTAASESQAIVDFNSPNDQLDNESMVSKVISDSCHGKFDNVKVKFDSDGPILNVSIQSESVVPISECMERDVPSNEPTELQTSSESIQPINNIINDNSGESIPPFDTENMQSIGKEDFQSSFVLNGNQLSNSDVDVGSAILDDCAPKEVESTNILTAAKSKLRSLQSSDQVLISDADTSVSNLVTSVPTKEVTNNMCQKTTAPFEESYSSFADSGSDVTKAEQTLVSHKEETSSDEVQIIDVQFKTSPNRKHRSTPCKLTVPSNQSKARCSALHNQSSTLNTVNSFPSAITDEHSSHHTSRVQFHNRNAASVVQSRTTSGILNNQSSISENIWSTVRSGVQVQQFTMNLISQSQNSAIITPSAIVDNRQDRILQSNIPSLNNSKIVENPHQDKTHSKTSNNSPESIIIIDDDDDDAADDDDPVIVYDKCKLIYID